MLGAFGPGNRQLASSWLRQKDIQLTPYLREALKYETAGAAIIVAIDATDVLTPALVEEKIANSENDAVKKTKLTPEAIADLVSSLKGVMLGITFGKQPYARIKIDFGQDMTALAGIADPLVRAALANHGAVLEEMDQWKVEVKGKQIFFSGYVGESGLMRIASMINMPTNALQAPASKAAASGTDTATQSPSDPQKLVLETTQAYFKSIDEHPEGPERPQGRSAHDRPDRHVVRQLCQQSGPAAHPQCGRGNAAVRTVRGAAAAELLHVHQGRRDPEGSRGCQC